MPTSITIVGNATADPELRFTQSGAAVANLTVAVNERKKVGDQWEDDGTTFYRIAVWREQAETVAETITKGMRVIVTGTLRTSTFTTRDGGERLSLDVTADEIAPSLRYATAKVTRKDPAGGRQGAGWSRDDSRPRSTEDPWASDPWGGQQ